MLFTGLFCCQGCGYLGVQPSTGKQLVQGCSSAPRDALFFRQILRTSAAAHLCIT